jgi:hypothetical protein
MVASITIILAQLIIYGLLVWVLAKRIGSYRPLSKIAFLLACLVVGLIAGLLTVFFWSRIDTVVYPNMAASLLGDQVYIWATSKVAPGVASPHYAIAWPLRIPQVYAFISVILFGVVGLVLQTAYNRNQN